MNDMENKEEITKAYIECSCGSHVLVLTSIVNHYMTDMGVAGEFSKVNQDYYLAMFQYGSYRDSWFRRFKVMLKYLRTGRMHEDQMIISSEEADKVRRFISDTMVETVK